MAFFNRRGERDAARRIRELEAQIAAMDRAQPACEFSMDGAVLRANDNLLKVLGYGPGELSGRAHASLLSPRDIGAAEQQELWRKLRGGECVTGRVVLKGKSGQDCWLRASYAPVRGENGQLTKVICFGTDITPSITALSSLSAR